MLQEASSKNAHVWNLDERRIDWRTLSTHRSPSLVPLSHFSEAPVSALLCVIHTLGLAT